MKKMFTLSETIKLPGGFKAAGAAVGLKKSGAPDMAILYSESPAAMAGTFTTNQVQAAPVKMDRQRLRACGIGHAVIINSGNANCCNGGTGLRDAQSMAVQTATALGVAPETVYVCSTGRIGVPLPMDIIRQGIPATVARLSARGGLEAAQAIMTTDLVPKYCTATLNVDGRRVTICGFAKGSGMIEPNMATMLAFIATDAVVDRKALQTCLTDAVTRSFNRISVDGDMSTNDTCLFFANGKAAHSPLAPPHADWHAFTSAVQAVCLNLAIKMARDGEGATKLVTVRVRGARTAKDADAAARSVANSMLVKTCWAGDYPNWGRIMDALGYSAAKVMESKVEIRYDGLLAAKGGVRQGPPIERLSRVQQKKAFTLDIDLHLGRGEAVIFTCNCTEDYVRINV